MVSAGDEGMGLSDTSRSGDTLDGSVASSSFSDMETKKFSERRSRSVRISFIVSVYGTLWVDGTMRVTRFAPVYITLDLRTARS